MTNTKTRGKSKTLKKMDWKLALEDAERKSYNVLKIMLRS